MADTRDCLQCGRSVSTDEMARYPSGRMKKICLACDCGRAGRKGTAVAARPKTLADLSLVATVPKLAIAAGYGVEARIERDVLCLQQGDDNVNLSREEARQLFRAFADWVGA